MYNTIAKFGYNTDLEHECFTSWTKVGTKYNSNLCGDVLGIFSLNNQYFLISRVTKTKDNKNMIGIIDTREITIENRYNFHNILLSNNELSKECIIISKVLNKWSTIKELNTGKPIELTKTFKSLSKIGFNLEKLEINFDKEITVCGIEKEKFEQFKNSFLSDPKKRSKKRYRNK